MPGAGTVSPKLGLLLLVAVASMVEGYVSPLAESRRLARTRKHLFTHLRHDGMDMSAEIPTTTLIYRQPNLKLSPSAKAERGPSRRKRHADPKPYEVPLVGDSNTRAQVHWTGLQKRLTGENDVVAVLTYSTGPAWLQSKTASSKLWVSQDYGKTFTKKKLPCPVSIVPKATNMFSARAKKEWYMFTDAQNHLLWTSTDDLKTLTLATRLPFTPHNFFSHFNDSNILLGTTASTNVGGKAVYSLYLSKNFGKTWTHQIDNIVRLYWGVPGELDSEHTMYAETTDGIISSDDFFKTHKMFAANGQDLVVKDNYIIFTQAGATFLSQRTLMISYKRGAAKAAVFPKFVDGKALRARDYFIADVLEDTLFVAVNHLVNLTNIYTSSFGSEEFSLSIERVLYHNPFLQTSSTWLQSEPEFLEWIVIEGFPSYIATKQLGFGRVGHRNITTVMSFDKGGIWDTVEAPEIYSTGKRTNCYKPNCSLHLANTFETSYSKTPITYTTSAAPGLVMAIGFYGKVVGGAWRFVVSNDAGASWTDVDYGKHFFQSGDYGGILVSTGHLRTASNSFKYSLDYGKSWHLFIFGSRQMQVHGLLSEPGRKSAVFTLFGVFTNNREWGMVNVDLQGLFKRDCGPEDYEWWSPSPPLYEEEEDGEDFEEGCTLGVKRSFLRRKASSVCFNGEDHVVEKKGTPCGCTRFDYECDVGYQESGAFECLPSSDATVIQGIRKALDCTHGSTIRITKGYRKIADDQCKGGDDFLFDPILTPCLRNSTPDNVLVKLVNVEKAGHPVTVTNSTIQNSPLHVALMVELTPAANYAVTWRFGDGSVRVSAAGQRMEHTYEKPGIYTVTVSLITKSSARIATVNVATHTMLPDALSLSLSTHDTFGNPAIGKDLYLVAQFDQQQLFDLSGVIYEWSITEPSKQPVTAITSSPLFSTKFEHPGKYVASVLAKGPINSIKASLTFKLKDHKFPQVVAYPSSETALVVGWSFIAARSPVQITVSTDAPAQPIIVTAPLSAAAWTFPNLQRGAKYRVEVRSIVSCGAGGYSKAIEVQLPSTAAYKLQLSLKSERTVVVAWTKQPAASSYKVSLTTPTWTAYKTITSGNSVAFTGLAPRQEEYAFFSVTPVPSSPESSVVVSAYHTADGDFLYPPRDVQIHQINDTISLLTWEYDVEAAETFVVRKFDGGITSVFRTSRRFQYITGLRAGRLYRYTVAPACTSLVSDTCPESATASISVEHKHMTTAKGVVGDITVTAQSPVSATIDWAYPSQIRDTIAGFTVLLGGPSAVESHATYKKVCSVPVFSAPSCNLVNLAAGKNYFVKVVSIHSNSTHPTAYTVTSSAKRFTIAPGDNYQGAAVSDGLVSVEPFNDLRSSRTNIVWQWAGNTTVVVAVEGSANESTSFKVAPPNQNIELLLFPSTVYNITVMSSQLLTGRKHSLLYQTPAVLGIPHLTVFLDVLKHHRNENTSCHCDVHSQFPLQAADWLEAAIKDVVSEESRSLYGHPGLTVSGGAFIGDHFYVVIGAKNKFRASSLFSAVKKHKLLYHGQQIKFQDMGSQSWLGMIRTVEKNNDAVANHANSVGRQKKLGLLMAAVDAVLAVAFLISIVMYCRLHRQHQELRGGRVAYHTTMSVNSGESLNDDLLSNPLGDETLDDEPLLDG